MTQPSSGDPAAPDQTHPDDATLSAWAGGGLPDEQADQLETHLETCEECARRLDELSPSPDPFLQKLRSAAGLTHVEGLPTLAPGDSHVGASSDANLMFGALALQAGLITPQQLADACVLWSSHGGKKPLADLLIEQGWIDETSRASVLALLAAKTPKGPKRSANETLAGRDNGGPSLSETLMLTPLPGERLRLEQIHSQGGIGLVWRAQDTLLGRTVALKELLPELRGSRRHRERFFREARVAAQLTHPGTAPVYEYREEGGRCYYTMRFYTGKTLTEAIKNAHASENAAETAFERLFPLLEQFLSVCDTVAYAHSQGVVHRDLKGENVVLGEYGEVTVVDWGLAKSITEGEGTIAPVRETDSHGHTIEGERLGTPGFMAPEQARGELSAIDERTDVYGLAAVLYEVLTGRAPFSGSTANEVMHLVETAPPQPPSVFHPDTPSELEAICLRGLSKSKEDRYESATALRDAVRHWLGHQIQRRREADQRANFFSLSRDLFIAIDDQGRIMQVNPAYEKHFGYDKPRPPGQDYLTRVHPDDAERARRLYEDSREDSVAAETVLRIQGPDGVYRAISWSVTHVPGETVTYGVGRPVDEESERRRATEVRARFFALSPNLFVVSDADGNAEQINEAWKRLLGWDPSDVIGKPFYEFVHPEDIAKITRAGRHTLTRGPVSDLEVRMRRKDGEYQHFSWTLSRVSGDRINYAIGRDLTGEKQALARLRAFLDNDPQALVVVNADRTIEVANKALCELYRYEPSEIEGQSAGFLAPEEERESRKAAFDEYVAAPAVVTMGTLPEATVRRGDGTFLRVRFSLSPLNVSGGKLSILVAVEPAE